MPINFPRIDLNTPTHFKTASFGMNCFWGPDARFGCMSQVIRTRVGYAGGTTKNPTYQNIGNYIETIQFDYDPSLLNYAELLKIFWEKHDTSAPHIKRQYISAIFYHDEEQKDVAMQSIRTHAVNVELLSADTFHLAEAYHQKYRLRQDQRLFAEFAAIYPDANDFMNSTAAARVNGYLGGFGDQQQLQIEINQLGLSLQAQAWLEMIVKEYEK